MNLTQPGGLFPLLAHLFELQDALAAARGTTVPQAIAGWLTELEAATDPLVGQAAAATVSAAVERQRAATQLDDQLGAAARQLVRDVARAEGRVADNGPAAAVAAIIREMRAASTTIAAATVEVAVTANAGNASDAVLMATAIRGDGRTAELARAETIRGEVEAGQLQLLGAAAVDDPLDDRWPGGSGARRVHTPVESAASLLRNGSFDRREDGSLLPVDWRLEQGSPGPHAGTTEYEQQTVAINGSPTSGAYRLTLVDAEGNARTTAALPAAAAGADVEAALRDLPGMEQTEVATTGTSPNFTHTITLAGLAPAGPPQLFTSEQDFDVGAIVHARVTAAGDAYRGRAATLTSDGVQAPRLRQILNALRPQTLYALIVRAKLDAATTTGTVAIDLTDGAGTRLMDAAGAEQAHTLDLAAGAIGTAWNAIGVFFRTPPALPPWTELRMGFATAADAGTTLRLDEAVLMEANALYRGGPWVAFAGGRRPLGDADAWEIVVTNNRGGKFQERFFRNGLTDGITLLPSSTTPTVNEWP